MSQNRPLMDVNEDSEILLKLGILTSKAKSKKRLEGIDDKSDPSLTVSSSITDDEDSDLDVLYDKRNLLSRNSHQENGKNDLTFPARKAVPAVCFVVLGLLNVTLFVTLPEIGFATTSTKSVSLLFLVLVNSLGCLVGNCLLKHLFGRCNPLLLLIFCTACSIPFTVVIAWCVKLHSACIYSFVLGVFFGFLHQGGLIVVRGNAFGVRTLLLLHICIAIGSMFAPLACLLFVNASLPPSAMTVPMNEISISPNVQVHKVVKRMVYLPQTAVFNSSEAFKFNSNGFGKTELYISETNSSERRRLEPRSTSRTLSDNKKSINRKEEVQMKDVVWLKIKEQVASLASIKLAYGFIGLLSFFCILFFTLPFFYCCEKAPDFTLGVCDESFKKTSGSHETALWQWLAGLFFLILSGTESTFSVMIAFCASDLFDDFQSQKKAFFIVSAFWGGGVLSRMCFYGSPKMANSIQFMQFLLLATSVVSCFIALFSHSSIITLGIEVFLVGSFISPVIPCILGWLEAQNAKNWFTLCFDHSVATSLGRSSMPFLVFLLMLKFSSFICLFTFVSVLVGCAFLILLVLSRSVRDVARVIAVEKLSETLMASGNSDRKNFKKAGLLEEVRGDGYIKLRNNDNYSDLEVIASDQEFEDEL